MLRQILFISPDNPANPSVDQAELVTTGIDRLDPRKLKIPLGSAGFGMGEWRNEASGCCIDVDRYVNTIRFLILVKYP